MMLCPRPAGIYPCTNEMRHHTLHSMPAKRSSAPLFDPSKPIKLPPPPPQKHLPNRVVIFLSDEGVAAIKGKALELGTTTSSLMELVALNIGRLRMSEISGDPNSPDTSKD